MNTATRIPATSALVLGISNGLIHDRDGSIDPGGELTYTFHSATTAKAASVTISAASRYHWVFADSSTPM